MNRTNRQQNVLEFAACSPETGQCRTIVRDEWRTGWVENSPQRKFLADGKRFVWESERNGWKNLYLYDLQRPAASPAHDGHDLRDQPHRPHRRGDEPAVLHGT